MFSIAIIFSTGVFIFLGFMIYFLDKENMFIYLRMLEIPAKYLICLSKRCEQFSNSFNNKISNVSTEFYNESDLEDSSDESSSNDFSQCIFIDINRFL